MVRARSLALASEGGDGPPSLGRNPLDFIPIAAIARSRLERGIAVVALAAALATASPAFAQDAELERLHQQVLRLEAAGQYRDASLLARRFVDTTESRYGRDHPGIARGLNNLAQLNEQQGLYSESEALYRRSLALAERHAGPRHPVVAKILANLGAMYRAQGSLEPARLHLERALQVLEEAVGTDHIYLASVLPRLANVYLDQGDYQRAGRVFERALAIRERALGSDHVEVADSLDDLGTLHLWQGNLSKAEAFFGKALDLRERSSSAHTVGLATGTAGLASVYAERGQFSKAEQLYRRSLEISEQALGPDHPKVASVLRNLGVLYVDQRQHGLAEPLFWRAKMIYERAHGSDHVRVADSLSDLGAIYREQKKLSLARTHMERALAIREKALGPDHPVVARILLGLSAVHADVGERKEARAMLDRAMRILEQSGGDESRGVAECLDNLAVLYESESKPEMAVAMLERASTIWEKSQGQDHRVAAAQRNLAILYENQGQFVKALAHARKASAIYSRRIATDSWSDAALREARSTRAWFMAHLSLLSRNPLGEAAAAIAEESFQIVQMVQSTGTAAAVAKMASRFAEGGSAFASLVRRKQDAVDAKSRAELQIIQAAGRVPQDRIARSDQALRSEIARAESEIRTVDGEIAKLDPRFGELTQPAPLSTGDIQALLSGGEAMLVYAIGSDSFVWVVTPRAAVFRRIPGKPDVIAKKVATIREQMTLDGRGLPRRVSIELLHELHQILVEPVMVHLAEASHIMVVPSGPLEGLPFAMLVASPPKATEERRGYGEVDWLARRFSTSTLPSVGSLGALRLFAKSERARRPFAGFGDPLTGKADGAIRGRNVPFENAANHRGAGSEGHNIALVRSPRVVDVGLIRQADRLPETADELRRMAEILRSGETSLWLRERATEENVKRADLAQYRIIAFATHGLMAAEVAGIDEAGLLLTPPDRGTTEDDGFLSASEISRLRLNADWVILSACNTAADDGTPGAEGLSGMAKAFFYAGARSILVSHWPVASEATVPLTTGMLKVYDSNPERGRAEAHRRAMLELATGRYGADLTHPIFWAPFAVVGEAGAGR